MKSILSHGNQARSSKGVCPLVSISLRGGVHILLLLASLSLGSFSLSSCTGTGGSAYSGGAIYNPDGTIAGVSGSDSSSNSTGGGVLGNGTMSAADILKFTQSNRTDEIVSILSEHGLPEETDNGPGFFTITLPAASIDLPDDGYATLQVLGGVEDYDGFSFVEDGNVCFRNIRRNSPALTSRFQEENWTSRQRT